MKHPWITRHFDEDIALTHSDEVKLLEAEGLLRKAQSTVMFLSIQRLFSRNESSLLRVISSDYMRKIDACNKGFYEACELNISPQTSHTYCMKDSSENDTFLDKTGS